VTTHAHACPLRKPVRAKTAAAVFTYERNEKKKGKVLGETEGITLTLNEKPTGDYQYPGVNLCDHGISLSLYP